MQHCTVPGSRAEFPDVAAKLFGKGLSEEF